MVDMTFSETLDQFEEYKRRMIINSNRSDVFDVYLAAYDALMKLDTNKETDVIKEYFDLFRK